MRRLGFALLLRLGLLTAAFQAPGPEASRASAADIAPLPAVQADSLVDGYGLGIHLGFLDTPYKDATAVADALSGLGVRHVRDDLYLERGRIDTAALSPIGRLAAEYTYIENVFTTPLPDEILASMHGARMRRLDGLETGFSPIETPLWSASGSTRPSPP